MEKWTRLIKNVWFNSDIHFTPTVWAIGILYDNRKITTSFQEGKGIHILIGPIVIRMYLLNKPNWGKWIEKTNK